ncbi:MAG TPA: flagellar basal body P-ring formation chaperone FlgA [Ignavibacteriales bacterium]|nr:flagellar basal body P-ring formation chaperone FlgA [Ignavibacteriales bacterium]HOL81289.1 flagellar basal body P-ring formation chaperone FlgA [Ignavibacteriales bacterium]HPP33399.1 flagellar basal body P-ring formation chaperone FlgA [Ignavibacteriales bacterium]
MKNKILIIIIVTFCAFSKAYSQDALKLFDSQLKQLYNKYQKIEYQIINNKILNNEVEDVRIIISEPIISFIANIPVEVKYRNTNNYKKDFISVKLAIYDNVIVAAKVINLGDKISYSDIKLETKNIIKLNNDYYNNYDDIIGKIAKIKISEGQIITKIMLKGDAIIKYNDKVKAILQVGNVEITFDAVAKNDGDIGEIINIQDKKGQIFKARVLNNNTVMIER